MSKIVSLLPDVNLFAVFTCFTNHVAAFFFLFASDHHAVVCYWRALLDKISYGTFIMQQPKAKLCYKDIFVQVPITADMYQHVELFR